MEHIKNLILQNLGKSGIYRFTNKENNKVYIGSTLDMGKRWDQHVSSKDSYSKYLRASINKHGLNKFFIEALRYLE